MIEKLEKYIINRLDSNIELNNTDVEIIKILIDNKNNSEIEISIDGKKLAEASYCSNRDKFLKD